MALALLGGVAVIAAVLIGVVVLDRPGSTVTLTAPPSGQAQPRASIPAAAEGTLRFGVGVGATVLDVNVAAVGCLFTAGGALSFATSPESVAINDVGALVAGEQTLTISATSYVHQAGETVGEGGSCTDLGHTIVVVEAASPLPVSGPMLEAGDTVTVTPSGTWCMGNDTECGSASGIRAANPDELGLIYPAAQIGSLIARIGGGDWFAVGAGVRIKADGAGRLEFLFNDLAGGYGDNTRSVGVDVVLERR